MECCVCFSPVEKEVACGNCTGSFCELCLSKWTSSNNTCPLCRAPWTDDEPVVKDVGKELSIAKKNEHGETLCLNKGCDEMIPMSLISSHFRSCKFGFNIDSHMIKPGVYKDDDVVEMIKIQNELKERQKLVTLDGTSELEINCDKIKRSIKKNHQTEEKIQILNENSDFGQEFVYHHVQMTDTLVGIATMYHCAPGTISRLNNLFSDTVYGRTYLKVPKSQKGSSVGLPQLSEEEKDTLQRRKNTVNFMRATKCNDHSTTQAYLNMANQNLDLALEMYITDHKWEKRGFGPSKAGSSNDCQEGSPLTSNTISFKKLITSGL